MSKNGIFAIIVVAVLIIIGVVVVMQKQNSPMANGQGRVVFGITDAATSTSNVASVMVTIDKIEVQNSDSAWVTVSTTPQQFDLLQLKADGITALLADTNIAAGTYNQIQLTISKVVVTTTAGVSSDAKLPSGVLRFAGMIMVQADKTSTAVLDFSMDHSLHLTGNGLYIFTPVIQVETKHSAEVTTTPVTLPAQANSHAQAATATKVEVNNGEQDTTESFGMDTTGEMKTNFEVDDNAKLNVVNGEVEVEGNTGASASTSVNVTLAAQNGSGVSGTAALTEVDGRVQVMVRTSGSLLGAIEPAHIYAGTCASKGAVKYSLNSVVAGNSTTVLSASMAQLKAQGSMAIAVQKSVAESGTFVACGNISFSASE